VEEQLNRLTEALAEETKRGKGRATRCEIGQQRRNWKTNWAVGTALGGDAESLQAETQMRNSSGCAEAVDDLPPVSGNQQAQTQLRSSWKKPSGNFRRKKRITCGEDRLEARTKNCRQLRAAEQRVRL